MLELLNEKTLHIDDEVFNAMRQDADLVLQTLFKNMNEKGSTEGKLTISITVSFTEEVVQNRDSDIEGDSRVVFTPKFQHKIDSALQIKDQRKGNINCDGMEMIWDSELEEYILRPIQRAQMSIYDMEEMDSEKRFNTVSLLESGEEDLSDEFDDYEHQDSEDF